VSTPRRPPRTSMALDLRRMRRTHCRCSNPSCTRSRCTYTRPTHRPAQPHTPRTCFRWRRTTSATRLSAPDTSPSLLRYSNHSGTSPNRRRRSRSSCRTRRFRTPCMRRLPSHTSRPIPTHRGRKLRCCSTRRGMSKRCMLPLYLPGYPIHPRARTHRHGDGPPSRVAWRHRARARRVGCLSRVTPSCRPAGVRHRRSPPATDHRGRRSSCTPRARPPRTARATVLPNVASVSAESTLHREKSHASGRWLT
jgi:hypothetical protein